MLSKWFAQASTQVIFKAAVQILKAVAGQVGERLWNVAKAEVISVQNLPISGKEKADKVFDAIKSEFPGIKDYLVNLVIELAVTHFKESSIKR
jgi:hypothetical protein